MLATLGLLRTFVNFRLPHARSVYLFWAPPFLSEISQIISALSQLLSAVSQFLNTVSQSPQRQLRVIVLGVKFPLGRLNDRPVAHRNIISASARFFRRKALVLNKLALRA